MRTFVAPRWTQTLRRRGLDDFDALWGLEGQWVEPPNQCRGGWSGVIYHRLAGPEGRQVGLYIKRQCRHVYRDWRHPLRGEATILRELRNIQRCQSAGVAVLEPLWCGVQRRPEGHCAMLVTEELEGYRALSELLDDWRAGGPGAFAQQRRVARALTDSLRRLHRARLAHGSLYPKHVFVHPTTSHEVRVRLIDLEKGRRRLRVRWAARRDLDTLNRHSRASDNGLRLRFLLDYLDTPRLGPDTRAWWRELARRFAARPPVS